MAFLGDVGRLIKNPVETVKKKTESLIEKPIATVTGDVGDAVMHYGEEIVEAPGDVWRQAENIAEDIIEGGEHLIGEVGDVMGVGGSGLPSEIKDQMRFDLERSQYVYDLMREKLPLAEAQIGDTYLAGVNLIQQGAARATQQAGRMSALGFSSGAIAETLRGIEGSVAQNVLPLTAQMQEALVQVAPAYAQAMMLGSGMGAQYGSVMAAFQQPSLFDRLLQIGTLAAIVSS